VLKASVKQPDFEGYAFPSPVPEGDHEGFSPLLEQVETANASPRNTVFVPQESEGKDDVEQEGQGRSQSRLSTGSSWNGPSFSPLDAEFPSGSQNLNRLSGVLEDDEAKSPHISVGRISAGNSSEGTEDTGTHIQGLNMEDLLEIQNVLAQSAMQRQASAQSLPVSISERSIEREQKQDQASAVERILPSLQGANGLGSPFMEEAEQMPSLAQLRRQPSSASTSMKWNCLCLG
jgi:hypothetical protein